ncbi:MAG: SAM hydrolase/SAM-dependent halogenase family protein [Tepidisphaeraceae bacterium]
MRPVITLTTDFGLTDAYVAEMKGMILSLCRDAAIVDVTHQVPPQDIMAGSIALERAVQAFPPGTVHVAVVDPGVGTRRKIIAMQINEQTILAPDNGLVTWAYRRVGEAITHELLWRPDETPSNTFHGRDIFAPAAAAIAMGTIDPAAFGPVEQIMLLDVAPARTLAEARVIAIDHFGNIITNVPGELLTAGLKIRGRLAISRTYADVPRGQPVALVGSSGLLEVAINGGNAAKKFKLRVGQRVPIK